MLKAERKMIIHEIHDLSNEYVIDLMKDELAKVTDTDIIKNYHPDYIDTPGNLFHILSRGRYAPGKGKYYVVEDNGQYICSAGWNEYELEPSIALMLTRMYIVPEHRTKYIIGKYILPKALNEATKYDKVWMTVNKHNKMIYSWFERAAKNKQTTLYNDWPPIYRNFQPLGKKTIYYTTQYVVELKRGKND